MRIHLCETVPCSERDRWLWNVYRAGFSPIYINYMDYKSEQDLEDGGFELTTNVWHTGKGDGKVYEKIVEGLRVYFGVDTDGSIIPLQFSSNIAKEVSPATPVSTTGTPPSTNTTPTQPAAAADDSDDADEDDEDDDKESDDKDKDDSDDADESSQSAA